MTPETLITLANLGRPRRPSGASQVFAEPALPDAATATSQLSALISDPVTEAVLPGLRALRGAAGQIAEALLAGREPEVADLNRMARGSRARAGLTLSQGRLQQTLTWEDQSATAFLARTLVDELAAIEPVRLRQCARPECTLLFYDTTRSRTRRWHAEDPCGWRERQQAHRDPGLR